METGGNRWKQVETGGSHTGPGLGYRVGVTVTRIYILSKPHLQPVLCEQIQCHEVTEVWLKHLTYEVHHKSKITIIYRFYALKLHFKIYNKL